MSTLTRCENGHFYDSEKYRNCPYCAIQTGSVGETVPVQKLDLSFRSGQQKQPEDIGETVGYYDAMPVKPVVGWLVAVEGASQLCNAPQNGTNMSFDLPMVRISPCRSSTVSVTTASFK